jgi:SNF2 family DNA or RNA helicase
VLVTKPKIAGLGLNLQHCAHVVTFVDHSYEKFYQCVRRCWRYGQQRPVTLDVIATEGEVNVRRNMERKERLAAQMFESIIGHMNNALSVQAEKATAPAQLPQWLAS